MTLGVVAVVLLPPLQQRLENQAERNLRAAVLTARPQLIDALERAEIDQGYVDSFPAAARKGVADYLRANDPTVTNLADDLYKRTGARVILTNSTPITQQTPADQRPRVLEDEVYLYDTHTASDDPRDIYRVLITSHTETTTAPGGSTKVATLLRLDDPPGERPEGISPHDWQLSHDWVLAVRAPPEDVTDTVDAVRAAFLRGAAIGLGLAIVLGLALIGTLTARLGRLRSAALRIAREGPGARPPRDEHRDEVGDLARAFEIMQGALDRQERARRQFVATASHELRTPLTSLGGTLELLQEDLRDPQVDRDEAIDQVALARAQVERLRHLASDLLDLSRLDAETELRAEPVELAELARAVAAEFEHPSADRDVTIVVAAPPDPTWARGDPGAVARTIRILLDNALRVAPRGSEIKVMPAYHGDYAAVDVIDRGPGVPAEDRERIFERFERGRRSGEGGFGLGLAIGRELAERQSGRLELLDPPGVGGARFRLTLPLELPGGDTGAARRSERGA